jgi:glycosyltransferase involved in cell wall biosynthesis
MFFSIILPTYNRAHYIEKAIKSVISQTFKDWELIVVDDASTDTTEEIVKSFSDNRIIYYKNVFNQERCITRNIGIQYASGKYICFLDSDDYHLPNHLEKLYYLIQQKNEPIAFFFTNAWDEDINGTQSERLCPTHNNTSPYAYFLRFTVNPQRWAVHRTIFDNIKFDPNITICEDMDTSLRIVAANYPIYQLNERTTVYVQSPDSFTHGDTEKAEKELFYLKKIFAKGELKGKLPLNERLRLYSMCYYHLAVKAFNSQKKLRVLNCAVKSFLLYPKGYNGKTNKPLLVMGVYSIPILGTLVKNMIKFNKLFKANFKENK